jgi:hypothetical protein
MTTVPSTAAMPASATMEAAHAAATETTASHAAAAVRRQGRRR